MSSSVLISVQTNPCQHPVIILQDVHFTELEALLVFIYKGEVNIEQKNLPALLKAAETLQIRGLSGGDIFPKESFKRLAELEQEVLDEAELLQEEVQPKKKQKVHKNSSLLEKALAPKLTQTEIKTSNSATSSTANTTATTTTTTSATCISNEVSCEAALSDTLPNPIYHGLEMKVCRDEI